MGPPVNIDPQVWQRIDVLLSEALTLPEHERERWLSGLPQEDQPLASSLRSILSRSGTTDGFMRNPVSPADLAAAGEAGSLEQAGTLVGPYRLLRALGAGGMGQVWLAERVDGTIQRQVAVKLPGPAGRRGWPNAFSRNATRSPRWSTRTSRGSTTPERPRPGGRTSRWSTWTAFPSTRTPPRTR